MTRITIDWLRDHDACWIDDPPPEQAAILAEIPDDGIPIDDFLRDDRIPADDRIWVATRPGALPVATIRRWLGVVLRRALGRVASPDAADAATYATAAECDQQVADLIRVALGRDPRVAR